MNSDETRVVYNSLLSIASAIRHINDKGSGDTDDVMKIFERLADYLAVIQKNDKVLYDELTKASSK